jgi:molybdopterin synthase sulfur carrier subunit
MNMMVKVKLFATFRRGRFREKDMELPDECTVDWVLDHLKIPRRQLGIIYLNGLAASADTALRPGDTLSIFPMVGGG